MSGPSEKDRRLVHAPAFCPYIAFAVGQELGQIDFGDSDSVYRCKNEGTENNQGG